jgi:PPOX class probable F420-dependent enzyme
VADNQRAQIVMSDADVKALLAERKTMTVATLGPTGQPHLVAMWFVVLDNDIWFETKAKSQKAVNLARDPRLSVLVETGDVYEQLRGVSIEGTAELTADADALWRMGVALYERYYEPYTDAAREVVEYMLRKRVAVRVVAQRTRSWDHRKLGYAG